MEFALSYFGTIAIYTPKAGNDHHMMLRMPLYVFTHLPKEVFLVQFVGRELQYNGELGVCNLFCL
jgi:hypothetical protein